MFRRVNCGERELVINKSRFIAISLEISSREDVKKAIASLRERFPDATHVCSGFIGGSSDEFGYDDDGEPSGTAGKPIYSAISAASATHSLIAVVRYFGGIKLGAGGLTRAYRRAASELIEQVGLSNTCVWDVYEITCDSETYKKISPLLRKKLCITEQIMYNENVRFTAVSNGVDLKELLGPFGVMPVKTGERLLPQQE